MSLFARAFNKKPDRRRYLLKDHLGRWINWSIGFRTRDDRVQQAVEFRDGQVHVLKAIPADVDVMLEFPAPRDVMDMIRATPDEILNMVRRGRIVIHGNSVLGTLFNFYVSLLMRDGQLKKLARAREADAKAVAKEAPPEGAHERLVEGVTQRKRSLLKWKPEFGRDPGVSYLRDPYLSDLRLEDFPRLQKFLDVHFNTRPEICPERALLLTEWFKDNGFEETREGKPWVPELRQALAFKALMERRRPIVREGDLLAGTTTSKEIGVVLYPDGVGTMIWGELLTVPHRLLNPYDVTPETVEVLHHEVFPYWIWRNFKEKIREEKGNPLCQQIDDRFAVYFLWKTVALSHTVPDFAKLLAKGTRGIVADLRAEMESAAPGEEEKRVTLEAMITCLEGLEAYAANLAGEAERLARACDDPARRAELEELAKICRKVPAHPAETLHEAVQAIWTAWVGLHMENTNAGLSIGRLDRLLQPYFEADAAKVKDDPAKFDALVRRAVELVACFFMRCTDHLPLIPDIGNYLFGGSSSDQAITVGGVTPSGEDAVCDMTYVVLKATEVLNVRDPNVNARYYPGVNSDAYLRRLCEVNFLTAATPSLHNDRVVIDALLECGHEPEDARDWAATGCVEPTMSGKHFGHTNCMMFSMVAALEMALNDGRHPLLEWNLGPRTGSVDQFESFEQFFEAFRRQFAFLVDQSVEYNNLLGLEHQVLRPTPLLSSLVEGTTRAGRDVTKGGAKYNSSGVACIGLADVTDSLLAIKKLVFDDGVVSFCELKDAVDANFEGNAALFATLRKKVPLFGSGSDEAVTMANRVVALAREEFGRHKNYRGGPYVVGFWSMSNHVAFGNLAGALPSGRLAGKAFTPGLTPQAHASENLLDNVRDVARLDFRKVANNVAFNVKVAPKPGEAHADVVEHLFHYAKTYFQLGGMQMQLNVVTSDTLRDAMARPEAYRNLLVRISGYNAYFVTLNRDMQRELIERAEFGG
ncbi:MAG: formate C-acetyltransferase/glycerol dehydratase family glycyl radical enzyme [Promethearchaeota archaeon]